MIKEITELIIAILDKINPLYIMSGGIGIAFLMIIRKKLNKERNNYDDIISLLKDDFRKGLNKLEEIEDKDLKKELFLKGERDLSTKIYLQLKRNFIEDGLVIDCFNHIKVGTKSQKVKSCQILSEIATSEALDYCTIALYDDNKQVKKAAINALAQNYNNKIIDTFIDYLDYCDDDILYQLSLAFKRIGDDAFEQLKRILFNKQESYRVWAIELLNEISYTKVSKEDIIDTLIQVLEDRSMEVRANAIIGLAEFKENERIFEQLIKMLEDTNVKVRAQVAKSLGEYGNIEACPYLFKLITDSNEMVRMNACYALVKLGYEGIQYLIEATKYEETKNDALQVLDELDIEFLLEGIKKIYNLDQNFDKENNSSNNEQGLEKEGEEAEQLKVIG